MASTSQKISKTSNVYRLWESLTTLGYRGSHFLLKNRKKELIKLDNF
ncbi:hypothetical protein GCM10008968_19260 [Bacillus horti]